MLLLFVLLLWSRFSVQLWGPTGPNLLPERGKKQTPPVFGPPRHSLSIWTNYISRKLHKMKFIFIHSTNLILNMTSRFGFGVHEERRTKTFSVWRPKTKTTLTFVSNIARKKSWIIFTIIWKYLNFVWNVWCWWLGPNHRFVFSPITQTKFLFTYPFSVR